LHHKLTNLIARMPIFVNEANCMNCTFCDKKHPLFQHLTEAELASVDELRYEVHYKAGETLFKQGTPSTHIICLTSGLVKIFIEGPNDKNLILRIARPAHIFGEPGAFVDNRHHYSARAIEDCRACFVDLAKFKHIVSTNPVFATSFISDLCSEAIFSNDRFFSLSYKQMHGRVAEALLYLSNKVYLSNPFKMSLSRADLAELTALSRESVIRILKEFKDEGLVHFNGDDMYSLDIPKLEKVSQLS
jgi:CRP/FNR family transcriptional regulator, polysaccharide utilization system transcription regulator